MMQVKSKLLLIGSILAALAFVTVGRETLQYGQRMQAMSQLRRIVDISTALIGAASDLAVERGLSNTGLGDPHALSDVQRTTIVKRREAATVAISRASNDISALWAPGSPVAQTLKVVQQRVAALNVLRPKVVELLTSRRAADAEMRRNWFPTSTAVITALQDLRSAMLADVDSGLFDGLAEHLALQNSLWTVAEFAGRERGMWAGIVAQGEPVSLLAVDALARTHGQILAAQDYAKQLADKIPDIGGPLAAMGDAYFTVVVPLRDTLLAAAAAGRPYPVSAEDWFGVSTKGVEAALAATGQATELLNAALAREYSSHLWQVWIFGGLLLACLLVVGASAFIVISQVTRPILAMAATMARMARADWTVTIPALGRRDELGAMAAAVSVFRQNGLENAQLRRNEALARDQAEEDRKIALRQMADAVERETHNAVEQVASRTTEMSDLSVTMADSAGHVRANSRTVSGAAEQAMANAEAVAGATEQLSASITEISSHIAHATEVSRVAVAKGQGARKTISSLSAAVEQIGQVANIIRDIASQTNLLALNATIEAARAGEAGKGFAVVAGEVKHLAIQTTNSTEEISRHIHEIVQVTEAVVAAVDDISTSIGEMDRIAVTIAAAVEQQTAATGEIARNVAETSLAAKQVAHRIAQVSQEANETGQRADTVSGVSIQVADAIGELRAALVRVVRTATAEVDRRLDHRHNIECDGTVRLAGGGDQSVHVMNISHGGAMLTGLVATAKQRGTLMVSGVNLPLDFEILSVTPAGLNVRFMHESAAAHLLTRLQAA
jgi:methyl-accepting chemotaxis protein